MDTHLGYVVHLSIVVRLLLTLVDQTLYPNVRLDDIEHTFHCGITLLKEEALKLETFQVEELLYNCLKAWSPPSLLNEELFTTALVNGAWAMAYSRYVHWHNKLEGKPYAMAPAHLQTFQARGYYEVSDPLLKSWNSFNVIAVSWTKRLSTEQPSLHRII